MDAAKIPRKKGGVTRTMRLVDKGEAPETEYKKYQDAEPDLEEAKY